MTKIKSYIAKIRQERGEEVSADKDRVIEVLLQIIENDRSKPEHKLTAIDKLARLQGWLKEQPTIEITNNTIDKMSDEELEKRMSELLGNSNKIQELN